MGSKYGSLTDKMEGWSLGDEIMALMEEFNRHNKAAFEDLLKDLERVKQERNRAFAEGFHKGALWGITNGMEGVANAFEKTAEVCKDGDFPPGMYKAFSETIKESKGQVAEHLRSGLKAVLDKQFPEANT